MKMSVGTHNRGAALYSFSISFMEHMLSRLKGIELEFDDISKMREEDLKKRAKNEIVCPEGDNNALKIVNDDGNETEMTHMKNASVPIIDEPNIYGREDDESNLVEILLKSEKQVIALFGMGGLGKTTLAQKLYGN